MRNCVCTRGVIYDFLDIYASSLPDMGKKCDIFGAVKAISCRGIVMSNLFLVAGHY